MWMAREDIRFLGGINRRELIRHQEEAAFHIYPCHYEELFCISVAESQVAGVYPITSACGSLATTNFGEQIHVDATDPRNDVSFVEAFANAYKNGIDCSFQTKAIERFSPKNVLDQWDRLVFNG